MRHNDAVRLDQAIAARFGISRRKAREAISAGLVLVNQRKVAIASREVEDRDEIAVVDTPPQIEVIAKTDDWIAVNKPVGMPTQPPRDRKVLSLEELLRLEYREIYLVHRLDTPTSGVVVFARTRKAAAELSALFAAGAIRKAYVALVAGEIRDPVTVETPIDGKNAITIVKPLGGSRAEVEIKTGRTHQIRIHLASIGHPVVGDRRYGGPPAPRLMLHAWRLEHPQIGAIEAPIPREFV